MFEVKNNGNLISGLASTTSAQLTAAQVVRCSASHTGPQHGQQDRKYVSDGFKMILKEQCVAWCIREPIEPCFPYFPSRCRIASAYLVSVVDVAGRGVQLLYIPASNTTFILNTNLGLGLLN